MEFGKPAGINLSRKAFVAAAAVGTAIVAAAMAPADANASLKRALCVPFNTGDGREMTMQMGAVMKFAPHAPMAHMFHVMGTDAFLHVNKFEERFENETWLRKESPTTIRSCCRDSVTVWCGRMAILVNENG